MEEIGKNEEIVKAQLDFYTEGKTGCKFAEHVAKNPDFHKWAHLVVKNPDIQEIDKEVLNAVADPNINQISILIPSVKSREDLENFIQIFKDSKVFYFEPEEKINGYILIKLRANIFGKTAWVSGFAPLDFLPKTRQSPYTELVLRVKDKPFYPESIQKPTSPDELHVADLEIPSLSRKEFSQMLGDSFSGTKNILGHSADELSAAKVTFVFPE